MPNLDHDVQNPADLLGQPISEGDVVAWGTTYGQSAALCVAVIEEIWFFKYDNAKYKNVQCPQKDAKGYRLKLRPLKSTGNVTWLKADGDEYREWRDGEPDAPLRAKVKNVQHVKNIVRLSLRERDVDVRP